MLALVTGAAGFIGSNLAADLLDRGIEVRGIDCFTDYYARSFKQANLEPLVTRSGFQLLEKDLLAVDQAALLDGVDAVFHLAAQAGVRASWGEEFRIYTDNNILATQRLLEACRTSPVERFVYASSSSVYGDTDDLPMREKAKVNPVSPYGVSKWAGEQLCRLYHRNFDVPTVALRYFTVYGPGQRPDMAFHRLLNCIDEGSVFRMFGDGLQSRDFTYVGDISAGTVAALKGRPGRVYNIGGGHREKLINVIRLMERMIGREADIDQLPVADGDVRHTSADMSLAAEELNFRPRTGLEEGLSAQLDWLRRVYGRKG